MTEWKFRVREISTNKIVDTRFSGYGFCVGQKGTLFKVYSGEGISNSHEYCYEYWTGLMDDKGVEIYEGDRVRAWSEESCKFERIFTSAETIGVVVRNGIHFSLLSEDEGVYNDHWDNAQYFEVL